MKKKVIIIISAVSLALVSVAIAVFVGKSNKGDPDKIIKVSTLEQLTTLSESNSSEAAELIKSNIVKVINKIDDETSIIGTGFFDKSGYLVTNSHLVDIKGSITIVYNNGQETTAELYSNDITSDIALLTVDKPLVKSMYYGKTLSIKVTDDVYAVGYPFAFEGEASVSKGVLSARRSAGGIEFLQSDISLNTGNSGGPLINDKAEVLGINTYATENASIGMAISSESLEVIINKLIENKMVNYIEETRPENALSTVLTEIGYKYDDLYSERYFLERHHKYEDIENREQNEENKQNSGGQKPKENEKNTKNEPAKDYSITMKSNLQFKSGKSLSKNAADYATLGRNLTNCQVDLSKVDVSKGGNYNIEIICDQNSQKGSITILGSIPPNKIEIPEIVMDETKNNVTSIDDITGIVWYYPGYADACQTFRFNVDSYEWYSHRMDPVGRLTANYGGGSMYHTFEEFLSSVRLWRQGNFLVVTYSGRSYTLTSIKGTGYYTNQLNDCKNIFESYFN